MTRGKTAGYNPREKRKYHHEIRNDSRSTGNNAYTLRNELPYRDTIAKRIDIEGIGEVSGSIPGGCQPAHSFILPLLSA
jgi:hypothetical protein